LISQNKPTINALLSLIIVAVFICVFYYFSKPKDDYHIANNRHCKLEKSKIYAGVIVREYNSKGPVYVLTNGRIFSTFCAEQDKKLQIGDSVYKPTGTFSYYIFKGANPDSVVFVECDFDCNIYDKK